MSERTNSYQDFVPNRYRGFTPPARTKHRPGDLIITSNGTKEINAAGVAVPRVRRG